MPVVGVIDHSWRVVIEDKPGKSVVSQGTHHAQRLEVALPEETFLENRDCSPDIAEVNIGNLSARTKASDRLKDGGFAAHLRDRPKAQVNT